jgi:D-arginine dehydrogenase
MSQTDILIIGAGMAGASAAYYLAPHASVVILEREAQPGYHTTGRSAAMYVETYGNASVRALTTASKAFYERPPDGFSPHPLLTARGALIVGDAAHHDALREAWHTMRGLVPSIEWWEQAELLARVPVLRPECAVYAVHEPHAMDMDVHAIHQGFLRGAKAAGVQLVCDAEVTQISREGGQWSVQTRAGRFAAPIVVNAAGAWCDEIARLAGAAPVGLVPKRRTAFTFEPPAGVPFRDWPIVMDADERFYFKPDAGMLLATPANEDPVPPQDVQPEELDVAVAVDRLEQATRLEVTQVRRKWAGLRSFVADRTPVAGFAPEAPGFFWLAGQGGYGIQTAPAMGELAGALVRGLPIPPAIAAFGVRAEDLSPARAALRSPAAGASRPEPAGHES